MGCRDIRERLFITGMGGVGNKGGGVGCNFFSSKEGGCNFFAALAESNLHREFQKFCLGDNP